MVRCLHGDLLIIAADFVEPHNPEGRDGLRVARKIAEIRLGPCYTDSHTRGITTRSQMCLAVVVPPAAGFVCAPRQIAPTPRGASPIQHGSRGGRSWYLGPASH